MTTQKQIELLKWESVEEIDFAGNGYCTDQVIYTIRAAKKVGVNMYTIHKKVSVTSTVTVYGSKNCRCNIYTIQLCQ